MNIYNNLNKLSNINLMNVIYNNQIIYYELRNNNYFKGNNYNFLHWQTLGETQLF